MRSAIFHENGGPEVIRIEDVPRPSPGPGEVLVEVRAAALNHLDLWVRRGMPIETTMPHIGGSDVAGVVVEAGPGGDTARAGERVVINPSRWCGECEWCRRGEEPLCLRFHIMGEHTDGGFAEYVAVPADHAYAIPEDLSFEEAAALPISYMTAWRALRRARLREGESVLVIGASGGTAIAAVQFAVAAGARVLALTKGAENVERLRALGAERAYDRGVEDDWGAAVLRDTEKRGVDVVVENVGGATWKGSMRALGRDGRVVLYGATAGPKVEVDLRHVFWKQQSIIGTTMASRREFEEMLAVVFSGRVRPVIDTVMPLDQAREAHERLEAGGQFGKIVLVP